MMMRGCARCGGGLVREAQEDGTVDLICLSCGASALAPRRAPTEAEMAERGPAMGGGPRSGGMKI